MVVDLDRCIGCNACAAACYAENNIGIVGLDRVREGREMAWLSIERYLDEESDEESDVSTPCSASTATMPHANRSALFLRRITPKRGSTTRFTTAASAPSFCSQNCPYKVQTVQLV